MVKNNSISNQPLRFAISGPWKSLHPGLQHTAYADLVLSNQFDALVAINERGVLVSSGAKSWLISDDFKTFTFYINTDLRFSDGTYLEAQDYKRSWEEALKLKPMSANISLQDVFSFVDGYKQFKKIGTLSGVRVISKEKLEINFMKPFRMAMYHLRGSRYSAYKHVSGKYLGTGKYVIKEVSKNELLLTPNGYMLGHENLYPIKLREIFTANIAEAFSKGTIDALTYGVGRHVPDELFQNKKLTIITGYEAVHSCIQINGKKGNLFSDKKLRLGLQYLLYEVFTEKPSLISSNTLFKIDFQSYLPIQPGRLDEKEVLEKIFIGKKYVERLINSSKRNPLTVAVTENWKWFIDELRKKNLIINSKIIDPSQLFQYMYKKDNYDIFSSAFSVVNGDPDGLYHALGKNGAILNPVTYRPRVSKLLEEGRAIIGQEKLDEHYKKVSRAILEEVPYVHIGFSKSVAIIRKDRIKLAVQTLHPTEGHLDIFEPK